MKKYKEFGFSKKSKVSAKIYTHPDLKYSIVEKIWEAKPFSYYGVSFSSFEEAMNAAFLDESYSMPSVL